LKRRGNIWSHVATFDIASTAQLSRNMARNGLLATTQIETVAVQSATDFKPHVWRSEQYPNTLMARTSMLRALPTPNGGGECKIVLRLPKYDEPSPRNNKRAVSAAAVSRH